MIAHVIDDKTLDDFHAYIENDVNDIRDYFVTRLADQNFVTDKTGVKMIELFGASFIADEPAIFGTPNQDYINREIEWYKSMSLSVNDFPGGAPTQWQKTANSNGLINSNYGYLIFSEEQHSQYKNVLDELKKNPDSRRTTMVYTRPSIWQEYNQDGKNDFICTNAVGYLIRKKQLHAHVQMRSNDVVFGYKNDRAWAVWVQQKLANDLGLEIGRLLWSSTSLHIYEQHFHLVKPTNLM